MYRQIDHRLRSLSVWVYQNIAGSTWKNLETPVWFHYNTLPISRAEIKNDFFGSFVILSFVQDAGGCRLLTFPHFFQCSFFMATVCSHIAFPWGKYMKIHHPWCFSPRDLIFIPKRWRSNPFKRSPQPYPKKGRRQNCQDFYVSWSIAMLDC